jgi:N-acetylglucosaminyl-diphospho-decaprenol L-rhamnosyltransferase
MTEPTLPPASIVIPTLDAGDLLVRCLEHVRAERTDVEVIVVDNASSDGSTDRAAERFPAIRIVRNEINRGYARACNIGAAAAGSPFVLFLNNDALLSREDLDTLLDEARRQDDAAIWQPVTSGPDGSLESAGDRFTWWGILQHLERPPDGSTDVFATVGAALLVRRDVFERLGGFEDSYFAYYEESDLCWRARMAGWEVRVVPAARVMHLGSETTARLFEPHAVRYLAFRNRIRTNLANPSPRTLWRLVPQHALACLAFVVLYALTGRFRSARAVLSALVWPIGNRDVLAEQRRRAQQIRVRSDADVFRRDLIARFGPREIARHLRRAYWFERAAERIGPVSESTRHN